MKGRAFGFISGILFILGSTFSLYLQLQYIDWKYTFFSYVPEVLIGVALIIFAAKKFISQLSSFAVLICCMAHSLYYVIGATYYLNWLSLITNILIWLVFGAVFLLITFSVGKLIKINKIIWWVPMAVKLIPILLSLPQFSATIGYYGILRALDWIPMLIAFVTACLFLRNFIETEPNVKEAEAETGYKYTKEKVQSHIKSFTIAQIVNLAALIGTTILTCVEKDNDSWGMFFLILFIWFIDFCLLIWYLLSYLYMFNDKLFGRCDHCGAFYALSFSKTLKSERNTFDTYGKREVTEKVGTAISGDIVHGLHQTDFYQKREIATKTTTKTHQASYHYKCANCGQLSVRNFFTSESSTVDV